MAYYGDSEVISGVGKGTAETTVAPCPTALPRRSRAVSAGLGPTGVRIGIHCHDDAGCGVANTLAAVRRCARRCRGRSTATANGAATRTW